MSEPRAGALVLITPARMGRDCSSRFLQLLPSYNKDLLCLGFCQLRTVSRGVNGIRNSQLIRRCPLPSTPITSSHFKIKFRTAWNILCKSNYIQIESFVRWVKDKAWWHPRYMESFKVLDLRIKLTVKVKMVTLSLFTWAKIWGISSVWSGGRLVWMNM